MYLLRNCEVIFHCSCSILCSHQQHVGVQFLYILANTCYFCALFCLSSCTCVSVCSCMWFQPSYWMQLGSHHDCEETNFLLHLCFAYVYARGGACHAEIRGQLEAVGLFLLPTSVSHLLPPWPLDSGCWVFRLGNKLACPLSQSHYWAVNV